VPAQGTSPTRLLLLAGGRVLAAYVAVPNADSRRMGGPALTSGASKDPGSGKLALVTGRLTNGSDGCAGLDDQTTVFPLGTTWSSGLGLLILPDGTTAQPGQTLSGGGGYLAPSLAKSWVADTSLLTACSWTSEVRVFNLEAPLTVTTKRDASGDHHRYGPCHVGSSWDAGIARSDPRGGTSHETHDHQTWTPAATSGLGAGGARRP